MREVLPRPSLNELDARVSPGNESGFSAPAYSEETLRPTGPRAQEFWSHLAELQRRRFRVRVQSAHWKRLFVTRDICWSRHDLKPALFFLPVNFALLIRARRAGVAIPQIIMQDLAWYPASDELLRIEGSPRNEEKRRE